MTTPNEWVSEPAASVPPAPPPPASSHRSGRRRPVPMAVVGLIVVLAVVVTVMVWRKMQPDDFTAHGTMQLISASNVANPGGDSGCYGTGGYSDLRPGAQVVVADADGKTLAIGELGVGSGAAVACVLPFTVTGVPAGKKFYGVSVSHRGTVQFTEAELKAGASLTIGDGS